jgi:hypothetical protein
MHGARLIATVLVLASSQLAGAAPATAANDEAGDLEFAFYLWGSHLDGSVGVGPVEASADASFSDIMENLEFAFMAALRGDHGRWAWVLDAQLVELENTETLGVEVGSDMTILELDLAYELREGFEVLAGARYVDVEGRLALLLPAGTSSVAAGDSWTDPVIGARFARPLGRSWRFTGRTDIGGFGVGSDFSWGLLLSGEYQATERLKWGIGYRILDIDYETGRGVNRFVYDTRQAGLITGLVIGF